MKRLQRVVLVVMALGVAVLAVWLRPAFTPPIDILGGLTGRTRSVATLQPIMLGGDEQWLLIRGADRSKPIVLFLHGDPGRPDMYMAHAFQRPLERDFVVVQWDRRGTGKSYYDDPDRPIRTSQEIADTVQLIGVLTRRFGQRQVILVGHSYGSIIGMAVAKAHPELVRAYVGVGQVACTEQQEDVLQDAWLKRVAAARGDRRIAALAGRGGDWNRRAAIMRYGGEVTGIPGPVPFALMALGAPEYTLDDAINIQDGWAYDHSHTVFDGPTLPLDRSIPALDTPVYFFEGRHDYLSPSACAARYAAVLKAPVVRMVWFEHSAHFPFLAEPRAFHREMLKVAAETAGRGG
jgi:pimeloyl-ACP methyl ester carboxylesterase